MKPSQYEPNLTVAERRVAYLLGEKIRELRKAQGYTTVTFAAAVGVTDRAMRSWEYGQRLPRLIACYAMANVLEVSIHEFLP